MDEKATYCIKINLPGGVVSAGDLYELLLIAENAGATNIQIGNRQQLFFHIEASQLEDMETDMLSAEISYEINEEEFPNIISSYVTDAIFNTESWIKEGVYKDIFDLFNFKPRLKINLVDRQQTFVPFFSGNFNFITSDVSNYWYLYVRFPKTGDIYCWPSLIYSDDIPLISKIAEKVIIDHKELFYDQQQTDHLKFHELVTAGSDLVNQPITEALKLPDFQLPYYEGFNRYLNNKYWLGIYRRNELFPITFMKDICTICLKNRVGQLYTTPWKSLLIKGINEPDRKEWGIILNKYRVNVRHASNELNWQLENLNSESLQLKQELVREFEEYDLRTYRLCFAIKMQPKTGLPGSIIIKKHKQDVFDILHTHDFNPNSRNYVSYKTKVKRADLGPCIMELCNHFYGILIDDNVLLSQTADKKDDKQADKEVDYIYQCKSCFSIYDKTYGDIVNGIAAGTDFESLDTYSCPVCESGKDSFILLENRLTSIK
ncbi:rubredoxin [Mucilaginibacter sp. SP1R1]|uniref:rubredoxin n=1 Tax=Mucilaginibacter sp. SP1R1 TaxID=2723091 RepID=UPI00160C74B1|nr:rubredoxin [Mucilaginibacter sp. SP1R1]MBB6147618.1 rubredoxin [Mucilaginibacter sp. SP1R1]